MECKREVEVDGEVDGEEDETDQIRSEKKRTEKARIKQKHANLELANSRSNGRSTVDPGNF